MARLSFELVSPERLVFSGAVTEVIVPGAEGEFGVLAGHAPFIGTLKPGILTIKAEGAPKRYFVRGGFAEVNTGGLTILAEEAKAVEEIEPAALRQQIADAKEDVADAQGDDALQRAERHLADLEQVAEALERGFAAPAGH
ncbi:F0F1 ATP synthase subunit epsilon [Xanthobacter agilis]|jgi:F-type H+-transporting ATPase subunit epsilon|uniref:ATP synthase epsilon chain n=1 Tax=Xanthobacter agilis TaxID=47492 RepID=A0ABU0L8J6_XANAG|nr:F0F1 ATP synthase subunit epsilon [Xanthobacter agilis]MDQ0503481.1 F-type H+-transporting ATPase subunit epsilon [Xanthobacter agilis]